MARMIGILLPALLAAGCAARTPPPDTALLPPNAFGANADGDVGAINLASWAFASSGRTRNDPVDAARAVVAVDYLAAELRASPRWAFMSPLTLMEMARARAEVRAALGIAPDAPSQQVVNRLLYAANEIVAGDTASAQSALQPPVFTKPPAETLALLSAMPFLPETNIATADAGAQVQPGGGSGGRFDD